ncbi:MAG: PadR family transcriptional regulator [Gemmatimonadota bacterium]|nr:PadR family transcriptional regulator [Gemmatimonadota bacterium]
MLGLIAQRPRHGYEVIRLIRRIQLSEWAKVGAATVYAALGTLARSGDLAVSTTRPGARPARNVFTITDQGRARLQSAVRTLLDSSTPVYSDRVVGAAFAWALAGEGGTAEVALREAHASVIAHLAALRGVRKKAAASSHVTELVLAYMTGVAAAERDALAIALGRDA